MDIPVSDCFPPFEHQRFTTSRILEQESTFITSDAGTGKTRAVIDALKQRGERVLILAPKSILQAAWGNDFDKFAPFEKYAIAIASNRMKAFRSDARIVITNHDAVNWLLKNDSLLHGFDTIIVDESTAFKNASADRSKALKSLSCRFKYKVLMSGTPCPNSITDLWHQVMVLDNGERLGRSFFRFRSISQENKSTGIYPKWEDKANIHEVVALMLSDITVRHKLEDCIDIPENFQYDVRYEMSPSSTKAYTALKNDRVLNLTNTSVSIAQASALIQKLLQVSSGSVYGEQGAGLVDGGRYDLILDLIEQREQCLVAFIWGHQKKELVDRATARKISFAVIDGSVPLDDRTQAVQDFQDGKIKVIFAHPQSAGHGLTLTKGTSTIWASPTYNYEHYEQFNRRIYRATQTQKTETIHIIANNTVEDHVYNCLKNKQISMQELLTVLKNTT